MKKTWTPRVAQRFYKEWALEQAGKLLGKVRYCVGYGPANYVGEVYRNGRTHTIYKGNNEQEAREAVLLNC